MDLLLLQERGEAARTQIEKIEQKHLKIKEAARAVREEAMVAKNARRDEKRRIKTLQGFDKKVRTAACASNRSPLRLEPARWEKGRLSRAPPPGLALRSAISWRGSASARRRKRMRTRMRMRTESHRPCRRAETRLRRRAPGG